MRAIDLATERAKRRPQPTLIFDTVDDALAFAVTQLRLAREHTGTAQATEAIDQATAAVSACLNLNHRPDRGAR